MQVYHTIRMSFLDTLLIYICRVHLFFVENRKDIFYDLKSICKPKIILLIKRNCVCKWSLFDCIQNVSNLSEALDIS